MTVRNLEYLFRPASVAVFGASNIEHSVGGVVMRNLLAGGFGGPVLPVNPKYPSVAGVLCYPDVASLPQTPELALLCTPPRTIPRLIRELGARGTRAAIVLSAGLASEKGEDGRPVVEAMLAAARVTGLRVLGPNCLGVIVPGSHLNASFAHTTAVAGRIAFVSQSGALCTAVLDWAKSHGIGFSHFVSLGDMADVDVGDILDYLGTDPATDAILLYLESVTQARKFMSAGRAAARNKPVLAIKAGRVSEGARAAFSHTGALAGSDAVYDAAVRRAGMLRVFETEELFDAVETLSRARRIKKGERLAILTNGGGPGVMATDALLASGGVLATLADDTVRALDAVLPATWSRGNPVDIIGDATPERYGAAMKVLLKDPGLDALLVMYVPTAITSPDEAARVVVEAAEGAQVNVLTCWLGQEAVASSRRRFAAAGIPTYETPDQAVRAFQHLVRFRRNQEMLMETPPSAAEVFTPATASARLIVEFALAQGRSELTEPEAKGVLAAYGIPVVETHIAADVEDALHHARELGYPVALKIYSPDITHKTDVGGVALDLEDEKALRAAVAAMRERVTRLRPDARQLGFTVQHMARRPRAHELIVGMTNDPVFGPVILFGQGGTAVEVIDDQAVALPPLNLNLADDLIRHTRVSRLLAGYRERPPADIEAARLTLIQVSQLVIDVPEIVELDINPLYADDKGVLALDARIRVARAEQTGPERLAIRPYPKELEEWAQLRTGRKLLLRPIRPEDEPAHHEFLTRLTPEDIRFRFFGIVRDFPHTQVSRFTQIDYDREMAFIASARDEHGRPETVGVVRVVADPDNQRAEFAIVVRSDLKGQGMGRALLDKMIRYCRARGLKAMVGQVLEANRAMLELAKRFGFEERPLGEGGIVEVKLNL
jgi:acetyltransferase